MKILASRRTFLSGMVGSLGLIAAGGLASCFGSQRQAIGDFNRVPLYPSKPDLLDPLAYLAACGTLAPSPFNTQPWVFYPRPSALEIYPDFSRKRAMADPHHRELAIALGAASEAMRVAAPVAGFSAEVETGTAISTRTPAVTVRLSPKYEPRSPLVPSAVFASHQPFGIHARPHFRRRSCQTAGRSLAGWRPGFLHYGTRLSSPLGCRVRRVGARAIEPRNPASGHRTLVANGCGRGGAAGETASRWNA